MLLRFRDGTPAVIHLAALSQSRLHSEWAMLHSSHMLEARQSFICKLMNEINVSRSSHRSGYFQHVILFRDLYARILSLLLCIRFLPIPLQGEPPKKLPGVTSESSKSLVRRSVLIYCVTRLTTDDVVEHLQAGRVWLDHREGRLRLDEHGLDALGEASTDPRSFNTCLSKLEVLRGEWKNRFSNGALPLAFGQ